MQPVLILQHLSADGPAYLATWLARQGLAFEVRNTEAGDSFALSLNGYGALAILGGEMSANDALPSLRRAENLFLQAVRDGVPTLGHCLGGQLMARALGAAVAALPAPEIGWQTITVAEDARAQAWFGVDGEHRVFQWHCDAFDLPAGATSLASSPACTHQAFCVGPHLAMQFHVELDDEKLQRWSRESSQDHVQAAAQCSSVQTGAEMRQHADSGLGATHALADRIYSRWLGLAQARALAQANVRATARAKA